MVDVDLKPDCIIGRLGRRLVMNTKETRNQTDPALSRIISPSMAIQVEAKVKLRVMSSN